MDVLDKYVNAKQTRDGYNFTINCLGCTVEDISIRGYQGNEVAQELIVDVKFPKRIGKLFGLTQQPLAFPIPNKFNVKNLESHFANGLLEITIPVDGGVVTTFEATTKAKK